MASTLEVSNIGPIAHASVPLPESGGLVVFKGRNGTGKSTLLDAVETIATGRGKPEVRDGALRGEISAFGVTLKIARSNRRSGELEVQTLDGKLSVAELVDPGIKAPEAADAKRIKALVQLTNAKPDLSLFHGLLVDKDSFEAVVSPSAVESADLVTMADKVKRRLEEEARKAETAVADSTRKAAAEREAAEGVNLLEPSDAATLQAEAEAAIREESRLQAEFAAADKARKAAAAARDELEDAERCYKGIGVQEAIEAEEKADADRNDAERAVEAAQEALRLCERRCQDATSRHTSATEARRAAQRHEATVQQWREQIAASIPSAPTAEELVAASERVQAAHRAVERGAVVRQAVIRAKRAEQHAEEAIKQQEQADRLREAAKGTDEVLSGVIAQLGTPLHVEAGRLVLATKRGDTFYSDLSHGERWKIALDIAIEAVGPGGLLVIPQEAYEALDPINRQMVADRLAGSHVVALTAEASEAEQLTSEVYGAA